MVRRTFHPLSVSDSSLYKAETNGLLLRFILATHEIKIDFRVMAKLLGPNCTPRAVQEKLKKLKKIGLEEAAAAGNGMEAASPRKRAGRAKSAASKEPKREKIMKAEPKVESKEKITEDVEESEKDDESVLPSPAKRPRYKK